MRAASGFEKRRSMVGWWFRDPDLIRMSLSGKRLDEVETISKLLQWSRHKSRRPRTKAVVVGMGKTSNTKT